MAKRHEPTQREISETVATLIAGGHEVQIPYHDIGSDDLLQDICPECDGKGYIEVFDDDWFCPIDMVLILGTLGYKTYSCNHCKQTGSISRLEIVNKENEKFVSGNYLGHSLRKTLPEIRIIHTEQSS
jgi:hypothetical protein